MPENTEAQDIITTAQEAVEPTEVIGVDGLYLGRGSDGATKVIDIRPQIEEGKERPARKRGTYAVSETHSFIDYLAKHGQTETELWGNAKAGTVKAVINAHEGSESEAAGWSDHTVTLNLPFSPDWQEWTKNDGRHMTQAEFAEFIEDHLPNFVSPTGADMLELAQTFQATTGVQFASSQRLKSGETQIHYAEETAATAGKKGNLTVPDTFEIGMHVYDRGAAYKLTARLRYRINGGHLVLAYKLIRPNDVLNAAFDAVTTQIEGKTERAVWLT